MDRFPYPSHGQTEDRGSLVAVARSVETVYVPPVPLLPLALYEQIEARLLMVSADGRSAASVMRISDQALIVVHSDPSVELSRVPFREAMIVQVYPKRGVKIWGDCRGERGIWMVTPFGVRLCARLENVSRFVRGPYGDIAVGTMGSDALVHVVRDSPIVLPHGVDLVFDSEKYPHTLLPLGGAASGLWVQATVPDRTLPDDSAGAVSWPLPFSAERVRMFLHNGKAFYLAHDDGVDAFWADGQFTRITPEGTDGGVDFIWSCVNGNALAFLLRSADHADTGVRRLLVNGRVEHEGTFYMRRDGFRWSSNGRHFVAHVTRTDSDGQQAEEILVTSAGLVTVGRSAAIHDPRIDNDGHLAYVLADKHGRHLVADGVPSLAYPYLWNISQTAGLVAANALVQGRIHRVEFSYGR